LRIDIQILNKNKKEAVKEYKRRTADFSKSQFNNNIVIYSDSSKIETRNIRASIFFTNIFKHSK
jgi:hypothetical protein